MARKDTGHFSAKHPQQTDIDPQIINKIETRAKNRRITCAAAHEIASKLKLSPAQTGKNIDLMELKITHCQLGLFGYNSGEKKVDSVPSVSTNLEKRIFENLEGRDLPCKLAWKIAKETGMKRLALANACETLGIRISCCQLGAFD